jgi:hypothetical protein
MRAQICYSEGRLPQNLRARQFGTRSKGTSNFHLRHIICPRKLDLAHDAENTASYSMQTTSVL